MKKAMLLLGLFLYLFNSNAQVLVAYYPFNGNANDVTGNGHSATVNGPVLTTDRFGNANSAYNFDGIDDFMDANADGLPTGDRTVSFWFNADPATIAFRPGLFGYGGGSCGESFFMSINNTPSATGSYQTQGHCNLNQLTSAYSIVPESRWYHWVVTIRGNDITMYINGAKVASGPGAFTIPTFVTGKKISMGAIPGPGGTSNYTDGNVGRFEGKLDDIRIFNAAMTDDQVFDLYVNEVHHPGSGNAVLLDGNNDYFSTTTTGFTSIQTYTIEFWFKRTTDPGSTNDFVFENGSSLSAPSFEAPSGQPFIYYVGNAGSISMGSFIYDKWYHIACQYDKANTVQRLYVDGVLKGTNIIDVNDAIQPKLFFGSRQGSNFFLHGQIDEVRVWEAVLSQTEIRNWMCRKVTPVHPHWTELRMYLRLDEMDGSTVRDLKSVNDAILSNGATLVTSGAALGDASANDYSVTPTVTLAHPQGEHVVVTTETGAPAGIQVYRVDDAPNHINGAPGIGLNNRYFGVHVVEGTSPTYTMVYFYDGNPYVNASNENLLALYRRIDNTDDPWQNSFASLDPVSDHLGVNGQSTEYILGLTSGVLPVTYESFIARKEGNGVRLEWKTGSELNNAGFDVMKSSDGVNYLSIGWVAATVNPGAGYVYSFTDVHPSKGKNFYRLRQKDHDGKTKLSEVRMVNFALTIHITVFPNPATDLLYVALGDDNISHLEIMNATGQKVWEKTQGISNYMPVPLKQLASGVYVLRVTNRKGEQLTQQFIRR